MRACVLVMATMLLFIIVLSAFADIPRLITYQGCLMDDTGNPVPDGVYDLGFIIYDDSTAGVGHWKESQSVLVEDGLFNVQLGLTDPLTASLFANYPDLFLAMNIIAQPEMAPRVRLTSSAFCFHALSVADDAITSPSIENASILFEDISQNGAADGQAIRWKDGPGWVTDDFPTGDITQVVAGDGLTDGGSSGSVTVNVGEGEGIDVTANEVALDESYTDERYVNTDGDTLTNSLYLDMPTNGDMNAKLTASDLDGGHLILLQEDATFGLSLFGGSTANGSEIYMYDKSGLRKIRLDADGMGTDAVQFPDGSISDAEIGDEPGIAAHNNMEKITLGDVVMQDLDTVSITIPSSGYIVVEGKCYAETYGTTGKNLGFVQIDETAGGSIVYPYYTVFGMGEHVSSIAKNYFPIYVTRIYSKTAGTYKFRMEGLAEGINGVGAVTNTWDHFLTATYYPTNYGSVATLVTSSEAGEFDNAVPETTTRINPDGTETTKTMYRVDLRELELREARLQAELEKTRRELLEARMDRERR